MRKQHTPIPSCFVFSPPTPPTSHQYTSAARLPGRHKALPLSLPVSLAKSRAPLQHHCCLRARHCWRLYSWCRRRFLPQPVVLLPCSPGADGGPRGKERTPSPAAGKDRSGGLGKKENENESVCVGERKTDDRWSLIQHNLGFGNHADSGLRVENVLGSAAAQTANTCTGRPGTSFV